MKYYLYAAEEQIEFLADLIEEEPQTLKNKFKEMIDEKIIKEYTSIMYDDFYRQTYRNELNKLFTQAEENSFSQYEINTKKKRARTYATLKAKAEKERIQMNNKYMPINQEFETLLDILKHSDLQYLNQIHIPVKNKAKTEEELKLEKIKQNKSFATKTLFKASNLNENKALNKITNLTELMNQDEGF